MNIINKTLIPQSNQPQGESTLEVKVYDIDREVYLTGQELLEAYSVIPSRDFYNVGEVVNIQLNVGYGTSQQRTKTVIIEEGHNVVEMNYTSMSLEMMVEFTNYDRSVQIGLYGTDQEYIIPNDPKHYSQFLTVENGAVDEQLTYWIDEFKRFKLTTIQNDDEQNYNHLKFTDTYSPIIPMILGSFEKVSVLRWGNFAPIRKTNFTFYNFGFRNLLASTANASHLPTRIPTYWTSLSSILSESRAIDIPSTWDVSNIEDISNIFGSYEITQFPSNLFVKSFKYMDYVFGRVSHNVDLSLVDYSDVISMDNYISQFYFSEYYDRILEKLVNETPANRIVVMGVQAPYTTQGKQYRDILIQRGWVIQDLGLVSQHTSLVFNGIPSDIENIQIKYNGSTNVPYMRLNDQISYEVSSDNYQTVYGTRTINQWGVNAVNLTFVELPKTYEIDIQYSQPMIYPYTLTKSPNKERYDVGEVVYISFSSAYYQNVETSHIVEAGDNVVTIDVVNRTKELRFRSDTTYTVVQNATKQYFVDGVERTSNVFNVGEIVHYKLSYEHYYDVEGTIEMVADYGGSVTVTTEMIRSHYKLILSDTNGTVITYPTVTPSKEWYEVGEVINVFNQANSSYFEYNQNFTIRAKTPQENNPEYNNIIVDIISKSGYRFTTTAKSQSENISFSAYLINDVPVLVELTYYNRDSTGRTTISETYQPSEFQQISISTSNNRANYTYTVRITAQEISQNVSLTHLNYGSGDGTNRIVVESMFWSSIKFANANAWLFDNDSNFININGLSIPNWGDYSYLFYGVKQDVFSTIHSPTITTIVLNDFANRTDIVNATSMMANMGMIDFDPRLLNLTNATNITKIFENTYFKDINGQNAYDLWLIHLAQNYLNKALSFKIEMVYTSEGATARQQLVNAGWTISDLGLEQHTLVVNTTPADATVVKTPNKENYLVGEIVTITVSHPNYVTQTIDHTIVSGVNTVDVVLEEDGYALNITAVGSYSNNLTVTKTPNKSRYQEGEFVMVTVTHSGTYLPQRKAYIMNSDITDTIRVVPDNGIYFEYPNVEATSMNMSSKRNGFSSSGVTYTGVATGLTNQSTPTSFTSSTSQNTRSIATPSGSNIFLIYGASSLSSVREYQDVNSLYFSGVTSEGVPIVNVLSWGSVNYDGGNRVRISYISSGVSGLFKGTGGAGTTQLTYVGFVSDFAPTLTASNKTTLIRNMFSYGYEQPYLNCSALDTSGVTDMTNTFLATYINCTLENWDFSSVTNMSNFMGTYTNTSSIKYYGGFSSPDLYDRLLNAWIQYPERRPANPIAVNFGKSKYTSSGASARAQLVALGFTITDAGLQS